MLRSRWLDSKLNDAQVVLGQRTGNSYIRYPTWPSTSRAPQPSTSLSLPCVFGLFKPLLGAPGSSTYSSNSAGVWRFRQWASSLSTSTARTVPRGMQINAPFTAYPIVSPRGNFIFPSRILDDVRIADHLRRMDGATVELLSTTEREFPVRDPKARTVHISVLS